MGVGRLPTSNSERQEDVGSQLLIIRIKHFQFFHQFSLIVFLTDTKFMSDIPSRWPFWFSLLMWGKKWVFPLTLFFKRHNVLGLISIPPFPFEAFLKQWLCVVASQTAIQVNKSLTSHCHYPRGSSSQTAAYSSSSTPLSLFFSQPAVAISFFPVLIFLFQPLLRRMDLFQSSRSQNGGGRRHYSVLSFGSLPFSLPSFLSSFLPLRGSFFIQFSCRKVLLPSNQPTHFIFLLGIFWAITTSWFFSPIKRIGRSKLLHCSLLKLTRLRSDGSQTVIRHLSMVAARTFTA